ncbi:RNA polymerase sigma factor [Sphingobacterium sp. HJSM2_6]|uniref:RNA polymerase sigma factor n=1 Tax=Sphingobacterium sp. HJSM2_6 TaxID=3366264 RepID=UPI003BDB7242
MNNFNIYTFTDTELLLLLEQEQPEALKEIMRRYENQVYQSILKFTKSKDISAELSQDIFIKLWEIRQQASTIKSISAWLYTLSKNNSLNYLKQQLARKQRETSYADLSPSCVQGEDVIVLKDYQTVLNSLYDTLPPKRKEIFLLKLNDGLSNEEIAQVLQISSHTVKNQLSKSYLFIRKFISYHLFHLFFLTFIL